MIVFICCQKTAFLFVFGPGYVRDPNFYFKGAYMEFQSRYSERVSCGIDNKEPSKTRQEFKDSSDVNRIMSKYHMTGVLPVMAKEPLFGDFTNPLDYKDSLNLIRRADEQFQSMPSNLRKEFDNSPEKFLAFMESEEESDIEKSYELGLRLRPEGPVEPTVEPIVEPSVDKEGLE